jgi:hypothetical protein
MILRTARPMDEGACPRRVGRAGAAGDGVGVASTDPSVWRLK